MRKSHLLTGLVLLLLGLTVILLSSKTSSKPAQPFDNNNSNEHQLDKELAAEITRRENERKMKELQKHVEAQEAANKQLEDTLESLEAKRNELLDLQQSLESLRKEKEDARKGIKELKPEYERLKREVEEKKRLEEQAKIMPKVTVPPPTTTIRIEDMPGYQEKADESHKRHAFNEYKSSLLPLDREIPDVRIEECKSIQYDMTDWPSTSIIICFVNEAWSTLLRTVISVLNRTPNHLIKEIILLDDASDADWLGQRLLDYVDQHWKPLVRVVRSEKRLGLIRARLLGAEHASGDIMLFLDSHCEANQKWLEPIVQIIHDDRTAVVTPVIDTIDHKNMEYASWVSQLPAVGTFAWSMDFSWKGGELKPGQKYTDPIDSPTMAGGLFAIDRKYFDEIGSYDRKMDGWGGENLEMSFRIWQCGGTLVTAPCSHVGHIFRETHPYTVPGGSIHQTFMKNSVRVAQVWMDEYKEYFFQNNPAAREVDYGDITDRLAFRKRLNCKPFSWYMKHVLPNMFVPDEKHIVKTGMVRNPDGQCIDKMGQRRGGIAGVYYCHGQGNNQAWMLTTGKEIRGGDEVCLDAWDSNYPTDIHLAACHQQGGNQAWMYDEEAQTIVHLNHHGCLESYITPKGQKALKLNKCNGKESQKWEWQLKI